MNRSYLLFGIILFGTIVTSLAFLGDSRLRGQEADNEAGSSEPGEPFIFQLELGGHVVGEYSQCYGLGSSNKIEENLVQTDGGLVVREKTRGLLEWNTITLKRTGPSSMEVWSWRKTAESGDLSEALRDGVILMLPAGSLEPIARWDFTKAWPASLTLEGSIEELTVVHEGVERTDIGVSGAVDAHGRWRPKQR